ncbi:MAG TPA: N-acetylmuramoyl-L-alanine amidase [Pseudonocardiaceae bacterium]
MVGRWQATRLGRVLAGAVVAVVVGTGLPGSAVATPVGTGPERFVDGPVLERSELPEIPPVRVDSRVVRLAEVPAVRDEQGGEVREVTVDRPFSLLGVIGQILPTRIEVRVRLDLGLDGGAWGAWLVLEPETGGPDGVDSTWATEPVWTGPARQVQVRAFQDGRAVTDELSLVLVDPGVGENDARIGETAAQGDTAQGDTVQDGTTVRQPRVVSRAQWGADEETTTWEPTYASPVLAITVHHTAGGNDYSCADSAKIVRGIHHYHAVTLGWGDLGYHVLVDKCGVIFEGRFGGLHLPVVGGHAGGFNLHTFGVSLIGNYSSEQPTAEQLESVARISAWKLDVEGQSPSGEVELESTGGGTAKVPAGERLRVQRVFGHRDVGRTVCPGDAGYERMEQVRQRVAELFGVWQDGRVHGR